MAEPARLSRSPGDSGRAVTAAGGKVVVADGPERRPASGAPPPLVPPRTPGPQESKQDALGLQILAVLPSGERVIRHTALDIFNSERHNRDLRVGLVGMRGGAREGCGLL